MQHKEHRPDEIAEQGAPLEEVVVNVEPQPAGPGRGYFLPISILIAAAMISGSIIFVYFLGSKNAPAQVAGGDQNPAAAPAGLPPVGGRDVVLGDASAPVTLIEYGDYQCPFCGQFWSQVEPQIRNNYIKTGKVKMVFRGFEFLGPESDAAGGAAECAKDQSKFWAFHDALYGAEVKDGHENSGNLTRDLFIRLAGQVGMDTTAFAQCIDSNKYASYVQQATQSAQADAGVNSTPTVFLNGQKMVGALPYAQYAAAIDALLKK